MNKVCRWQERTSTKKTLEKTFKFERKNKKINIVMGQDGNNSSLNKEKVNIVNGILSLFYRRIY